MSTPQEPRPPTLSFSIATRGAPLPPRAPESPFVIALFGDFSGRAGRGILNPVAGQTPVAIDIDNFAGTLARFAPTLELPDDAAPDGVLALSFRELDDFHPDQIAPRLLGLQRLQALRPRLSHPATSAQAEQELRALLDRAEPATATAPESDADTLARLLGNASPAPPPEPEEVFNPFYRKADALLAFFERLFIPGYFRPPRGAEAAIPERIAALLRRPMVLLLLALGIVLGLVGFWIWESQSS